MVRKTKDEAEKTRHALLDAAENLFLAHGVTRTSLEHIAAAAHMTRGAVYWHFKNKVDLCEAMMLRVFLPHEDMLKELASTVSETPLQDLEKSFIHALRMMARDERRQKVVTIMSLRCEYVADMKDFIGRRNACKDHMLALSEKLFKRARALGHLDPAWTPRKAAVASQALMTGLIHYGLEERKAFHFEKMGIPCIKAFFAALQSVKK